MGITVWDAIGGYRKGRARTGRVTATLQVTISRDELYDVLGECEIGQCDGCEDWYHMDRLDNGDGDGGGGLWCQWCMPDE